MDKAANNTTSNSNQRIRNGNTTSPLLILYLGGNSCRHRCKKAEQQPKTEPTNEVGPVLMGA